MEDEELRRLRKRYAGMETTIVSTDKAALTMLGSNGRLYHQRPDHFWSDSDGDEEGTLLWNGGAFHDHGIHMRPLFVMHEGFWTNIFTGKKVDRCMS